MPSVFNAWKKFSYPGANMLRGGSPLTMPVSHPTLDLYGTVSRSLAGKKIVLAVTGSIAAVETIKLARELIRHGAEVQAVMSAAAQTIIHPYALQYATGRDVITEITGNVEHVAFCGARKEAYDLLLIAPCTANTIGKIAAGSRRYARDDLCDHGHRL